MFLSISNICTPRCVLWLKLVPLFWINLYNGIKSEQWFSLDWFQKVSNTFVILYSFIICILGRIRSPWSRLAKAGYYRIYDIIIHWNVVSGVVPLTLTTPKPNIIVEWFAQDPLLEVNYLHVHVQTWTKVLRHFFRHSNEGVIWFRIISQFTMILNNHLSVYILNMISIRRSVMHQWTL